MTDECFLSIINRCIDSHVDYCDLDDILQGDCSECPYRMNTPPYRDCIATSYEMMRLL